MSPANNNRVDPSPYYPVFRRRMVMISYARRPRTGFPNFSPPPENGVCLLSAGEPERSRAERGPVTEPSHTRHLELIAAVQRQWVDALTDLGGRNTLLYYKDRRAGTLDLASADPDAMERFEKTGGSRLTRPRRPGTAARRPGTAGRRSGTAARRCTTVDQRPGTARPGYRPHLGRLVQARADRAARRRSRAGLRAASVRPVTVGDARRPVRRWRCQLGCFGRQVMGHSRFVP
jgi:hypothetical protein